MKIGLLGGTFDPIHKGHLQLARAAQKAFQLNKILFIPAFIPPHKKSQRDLTPAPYRLEMVQRAIEGEETFEVSDMELNRPEISYTVDTLKILKHQNPHDELFLILGADSLREIGTWREPESIKQLAKLLVAPRENLDLKGDEGEYQMIPMPLCPISSTEIRLRLKRQESVQDILPKNIEAYIRGKGLYASVKREA